MPFYLIVCLGIFSVLLLLTSAVMCIVCLVNSKKSGFIWLGALGLSVLGLLMAFRLTFKKVETKINTFKDNFNNSLIQVGDSLALKIDSLSTKTYNNNSNKQVNYLKQLYLKTNTTEKASDEFYGYYGFRDYYRYPLVYPYSLHCIDFVDDGALFDESNVIRFDENNNGEIDCNFNGIKEFDFTENYLITRKPKNTKSAVSKEYTYYIFDFISKEVSVFNTKQEFNKGLELLKINKVVKFVTVKEYSILFD